MNRFLLVIATAVSLSGCAHEMTLMGRDSGKTYKGELTRSSGGAGSMTVQMGDNICSGPVARVASNQTFGFSSTYARTNSGATANAVTNTMTTGDSTVKGILTCSNGGGLRCDMTGRGGSSGGICVDDAGKVYDAIALRR